MAGLNKLRLCACLLNISEAKSTSIVERVASSALKVNSVAAEPEGYGLFFYDYLSYFQFFGVDLMAV